MMITTLKARKKQTNAVGKSTQIVSKSLVYIIALKLFGDRAPQIFLGQTLVKSDSNPSSKWNEACNQNRNICSSRLFEVWNNFYASSPTLELNGKRSFSHGWQTLTNLTIALRQIKNVFFDASPRLSSTDQLVKSLRCLFSVRFSMGTVKCKWTI